MTNEKLKFQLTSYVDVLCYVLERFNKYMADYQTIRLFELVEAFCIWIVELGLEFGNNYLCDVKVHLAGVLLQA